ncbi:MAG: hypothetical protein NXI10_04790 [bacterium]|nr:hypothetical protein [bacterium]
MQTSTFLLLQLRFFALTLMSLLPFHGAAQSTFFKSYNSGTNLSSAIFDELNNTVYLSGRNGNNGNDAVILQVSDLDGTANWVLADDGDDRNGPSSNQMWDEFSDIQLNSAGSIIGGGLSTSYSDGQGRFYLAEYSNTGVNQWSADDDYAGNQGDVIGAISLLPNDSIFSAGTTSNGQMIAYSKYDANGDNNDLITLLTPYGFNQIEASAMKSNGAFVVCGFTNAFSGTYAMIFQVNRDGTTLDWFKTYHLGGSIGYTNQYVFFDILVDSNDDILIAGYTDHSSYTAGGYDQFVTKFDGSGNVIWSTLYGMANEDQAYGLTLKGDGSILTTGRIDPVGAPINADLSISALDANGNFQWMTGIANPLSPTDNERGIAIQEMGDLSIMVAGHVPGQKMLLMRTGSTGEVLGCNAHTSYVPTVVDITSEWTVTDRVFDVPSFNYFPNTAVTPGSIVPVETTAGAMGTTDLCPITVLPVTMGEMAVDCSGSDAFTLHWQTLSELNNHYFSIYGGNDLINWERIAVINGAGNSNNVTSYSWTSEIPYEYVFIEQTDFNGATERFDPMSVGQCFEDELHIYQQNGQLYVSGSDILEMQLLDTKGRIISILPKEQYFVPIEHLSSGAYILQIHVKNKGWMCRKLIL